MKTFDALVDETAAFMEKRMERCMERYIGGPDLSPEQYEAMMNDHEAGYCRKTCLFCTFDADAETYLQTLILANQGVRQ